MKRNEVRKKSGKRIRFVQGGGWGPIVKEGYGEVEVGEGDVCEGFDKDVDDDVGIIEISVELVANGRVVRSVGLLREGVIDCVQFEDRKVG